MAELMIDAKDVTRNFTISRGMFRGKQQLKAVNGVDLTVERGEVLALVGESGCGKTTLAKVLLGLLPQTSGTVELCGQPINDVPRWALAPWLDRGLLMESMASTWEEPRSFATIPGVGFVRKSIPASFLFKTPYVSISFRI